MQFLFLVFFEIYLNKLALGLAEVRETVPPLPRDALESCILPRSCAAGAQINPPHPPPAPAALQVCDGVRTKLYKHATTAVPKQRVCSGVLAGAPTSWRWGSSGSTRCRPRRSRGRGPGSTRRRPSRRPHSGAATSARRPEPSRGTAVAVGAQRRRRSRKMSTAPVVEAEAVYGPGTYWRATLDM